MKWFHPMFPWNWWTNCVNHTGRLSNFLFDREKDSSCQGCLLLELNKFTILAEHSLSPWTNIPFLIELLFFRFLLIESFLFFFIKFQLNFYFELKRTFFNISDDGLGSANLVSFLFFSTLVAIQARCCVLLLLFAQWVEIENWFGCFFFLLMA